MTFDADSLYRLLPAVHRIRDAEQGEPLRALIALFAQELGALEENLDQLYDDQFIETCAPWAAPYIGDLIGYRPLHGVAPRIASPRADIANTIRNRRRKGTALMLEELARDVTGWPARAVEFFEQLVTTQFMNHPRPHALATANLRDVSAMLNLGGAFNRVAHTAEMRRPETAAGRYNIPNIGIFLWRLAPIRLSNVPMTPHAGDATGRRFRVNPLGADMPLFRDPDTDSIEHLATPVNVPAPLGVRELALQWQAIYSTSQLVVNSGDYGIGRSIVLLHMGGALALNQPDSATPGTFIPLVRSADLRDVFDAGGIFAGWAHEDDIGPNEIGIDVRLGRVLLGAAWVAQHAASPLRATYHYAQQRPIGGGEYAREPQGEALTPQISVANSAVLPLAAIAGGGRLLIQDSLVYAQTPVFTVDGVTAPNTPGHTVVVAAKAAARPLIAAGGAMSLNIGARGTLVLDGLVVSGGPLELAAAADNEPRTLILRDCTLVPGRTLNPDGGAVSPGAPSLIVAHPFTRVVLERCITGPLQIRANSDVEVELRDCIVDAGAPDGVAYDGDGGGNAGARLTLRECTLIGKVHTQILALASNTLFFARRTGAADAWRAPLIAQRRQEGCVRFCYLPAGAITPRRHRCVSLDDGGTMLPHFTSLRYGDPGYCQLRGATPKAIRQGADDEGEIGVMHPLFQPQRETNLRIRLDEYLRFGLRAGFFYAT